MWVVGAKKFSECSACIHRSGHWIINQFWRCTHCVFCEMQDGHEHMPCVHWWGDFSHSLIKSIKDAIAFVPKLSALSLPKIFNEHLMQETISFPFQNTSEANGLKVKQLQKKLEQENTLQCIVFAQKPVKFLTALWEGTNLHIARKEESQAWTKIKNWQQQICVHSISQISKSKSRFVTAIVRRKIKMQAFQWEQRLCRRNGTNDDDKVTGHWKQKKTMMTNFLENARKSNRKLFEEGDEITSSCVDLELVNEDLCGISMWNLNGEMWTCSGFKNELTSIEERMNLMKFWFSQG